MEKAPIWFERPAKKTDTVQTAHFSGEWIKNGENKYPNWIKRWL